MSDTEDLLAATLPAEAIEDIKEELMGEIEAKNRQLEQLHQQLVNLQAALKVSDNNLKVVFFLSPCLISFQPS